MLLRLSLALCLCALPLVALAQSAPEQVRAAADALFDEMPGLLVGAEPGACGRDASVTAPISYCTTSNTLLAAPGALESPEAAYRVAHLLGHAIQVRHGIADIALREVRARPDEESKLRGMVTRQVECLAGVLIARAGLAPMSLGALFEHEPHTGSHWGRNPLRIGPRVSIGLAARAQWFDRGQRVARIEMCAVGEIPVAPLVEALRP